MSHGLTTWDANGNVQMTTDDFTYQIMYSAVHTPPVTVSVPGFDPSKCTAVILPVDAISEFYMQNAENALPYVALGQGVISVARQTPSGTASTGATVLRFRLLVMRYSN